MPDQKGDRDMPRHIADMPANRNVSGRLRNFVGHERREHPSKLVDILRRQPRTRLGSSRLRWFLRLERVLD
jgi:hypothetical protein